jgi:hypothetical protein
MGDEDLVRHFFGGFVRLHILYQADKEAIAALSCLGCGPRSPVRNAG